MSIPSSLEKSPFAFLRSISFVGEKASVVGRFLSLFTTMTKSRTTAKTTTTKDTATREIFRCIDTRLHLASCLTTLELRTRHTHSHTHTHACHDFLRRLQPFHFFTNHSNIFFLAPPCNPQHAALRLRVLCLMSSGL